jgi:hypothetical protein
MEYNLRKLFEQIKSISKNREEFTVEELWKWTKFDGSNEYLNEKLKIHEYSGVPIIGRNEILNDQIILGDYLLFDYIGHLPQFSIKQYRDFENLLEAIISQDGILNNFTTLQMPIIKGKAKNILFSLEYKNKISFENILDDETIEKIRGKIIKICG